MKKTLLNLVAISTVVAMAGTVNANAQENHDFTGSYSVNSMYFPYEGSGDEFFSGDYPLLIDNNNMVTEFATFDLSAMGSVGLGISGNVKGNTFTFTSALGMLVVSEESNGHYILLSGGGYDSEYTNQPVELIYDSEYDQYSLSEWALWDYDPSNNTYTKLGMCIVFGVTKETGSGDSSGKIEFIGTYTAKGLKTVYTNGVAGEPIESEFVMEIQDDGSGDYEFTQFAGYEVGYTSKGWLGVFGPSNGNIIEIQGDKIDSSAQNGLMVGCPFTEYDSNYVVAISFESSDKGSISNFGVWSTTNNSAVELLEVWSGVTFTTAGGSGVETIQFENSDSNSPVEYYNIQGVKVQNPSNGLYIIKQGDKTRKVYLRK